MFVVGWEADGARARVYSETEITAGYNGVEITWSGWNGAGGNLGNVSALGIPEQMLLFGAAKPAEPSAVDKELDGINPDDLSPKEAQELLYHLKKLSEDSEESQG